MATQNASLSPPAQDTPLLDRIAPWISPLVAALIVIGMFLAAPALGENRSNLKIITFLLMWIALTSSWNLIGGYTGYIDFGHSVFVGIGGYTVGILVARLGILAGAETVPAQQAINWPFLAALPVAFIVGAAFAGIIGYPTLRLKGPYFSIAMLGMLVAMREIVRNNPFELTNGGVGLSFVPPFARPLDVYYIMLAITALIFFASFWMYRVQLGKMLRAVRDDEVGADMRGINTTMIKIGIFMLAGGFTAMVGGTKGWWDAYIDPETIFPPTYNIEIIMMAMLGGLGRPWGPVIGASVFYLGRTVIWATANEFQLALSGLLLAFIVLFMRGGILGLIDPEDRGLTWVIRYYLLGQRDEVFSDDEDFTFTEIPETALVAAPTAAAALATNGHRVVLEGQGVTKDFGGLRAVDHVDFKIREGEIVGLLGPNGSGKTTLFNCISGVLKPSEGAVYIDSSPVTGFAPWRINRSGLSRTFQRLRIYGRHTVYENMLLARKWEGVPPYLWLWIAPGQIRAKTDELLEFLRIDHVRNNLAHNLSGGQQRLLEMGMTLMCDPVVVLLDEATSGVNPALVEDIKDNIRRLNQERGVTFFLVEHNMNFAMTLCERLYVLDYGKLIAEGTPEQIQNDPQVVEAYFGRDE
jgi:branched-chain amino acid transport system permease protein